MSSAAFERLEQLTEIPAMDLLLASDHVLTPAFSSPKKSAKQELSPIREAMLWIPRPQKQDFHPANASWYCPKCLKEGAYQRRSWRPAPMAACLQHDCLLVDRCPNCQQSVSVLDLVLACCHQCRTDLCLAGTVSLNEDRWGRIAQATLLGWRTNTPSTDSRYGWPEHPFAILCSLAEGLAVGMLSLTEYLAPHPLKPPKPLTLYRLNDVRVHVRPPDVYWAYSCALKFMSNWPEGFRTFLHLVAPEPEISLRLNLGLFYSYWITTRWEHPNFNFVRDAFEDFLWDRSWFAKMATGLHVAFAQAPHFARLKEAAAVLSIPENALIRLGQVGLLTEISSVASEKLPTRFFLRSDLRELKHAWAHPISLQEASHWLGLSPKTVLRLTKERVLKVISAPGSDVHFARTEVTNLISRVDNRALVTDALDDVPIRLADAAEQLACVHLDEARLLQLTVSRKLQAWRCPSQHLAWDCGEISFTRKDLDLLMRQRAKEKGWISAENAAFALKVEDDVFLGWIARGFLKTVASYNGQLYLKQKYFDQFRAEHIFFNRARDLLGITTQRMMGYVRRGKLVPIAGPGLDGCYTYLFPLRKVEMLARHLQKLQQKRLTAAESD